MEAVSDLPNDSIRNCLLRTAYKTHRMLKSVCRDWKAMLSSPRFYVDRRNIGTSEHFICLLHHITRDGEFYGITLYDPLKGTLERLPPIRYSLGLPLECKCVSVNRKLVVFRWMESLLLQGYEVGFIYDFETHNWRRGADMLTLRTFFSYSFSPSTGLIYVAGGNEDESRDILASAEAYNVETDSWVILPAMTQRRAASVGVFIQGRFMVIAGERRERLNQFHTSADVFDPNTGTWSRLEGMWTLNEVPNDCVLSVSSGHLYVFNYELQQVMMYDAENNVWTAVAPLPRRFHHFFCAVEWLDRIFVHGADSRGRKISYMFQPLTARWTALEWREDFACDVSAAYLEI